MVYDKLYPNPTHLSKIIKFVYSDPTLMGQKNHNMTLPIE